jgi:acyl-CoA dehydrogenase
MVDVMYTGSLDGPDDVFADVLKQVRAFVRTRVLPRELEKTP